MKGHLRYRSGAWRLTADAGQDPVTGQRQQVHRTVHAPNTKGGRRTAETELARLVAEAAAGRVAPAHGVTAAELLERYVRHREHEWSPGSGAATRARIAQHITPYIGEVAVERVRPVDIDNLYGRWRKGGMGASTVARHHDVLRAAFRQAVRWDLIDRSPFDRIDPPKRTRTEIAPPSPADVAKLLAAADDSLRMYLRLSAVTGARRGQVCALRWPDIDFDAGEIRWTRALAKVAGGVVEKETKTGARYPVAIDPGTVEALKAHRLRQVESSLAVGKPLAADAYVFSVDPAGEKPWHPDGASQRFATLRKQVGLESVRLHDLRHFMATQMLAEGFDVATLTGRGGWSDAATPLAVYAHFQPARDRAAADRLGEVIDGAG